MKPIFLSYVRENEEIVDKFCQELISRDLKVWLDRQDLNPGSRWKQEIRKAIREGAFFVACFSKEQNKSDKTYMNEELTIAIDELHQKPSERIWFIPVKLNRCKIPDRNIGGGETLRDLHYINLYKDWNVGIQSILKVVQPEPSGPTKHENTSGNRVDSNTATDFSEGCIDQDSTKAENTFDTEKRDNDGEKVTENSLKGFITYSHEDTAAKDELRKRLAVMEQKNELTTWHDGEIAAGDEWYEDISKNLAEADILLYLVSAASLASKNCNKELAEALTANIKVIPIILEHCDWQQHQLSDFEVLPLKGKPISQWEDPSEGWQNVVEGIRAVISKMQVQAKPSPNITPEEVEILSKLVFQKGNFLMMLDQMDEAIEVYSRAIELNPNHAASYSNRGAAYCGRDEFDLAIADYNKAIELDPELAQAYSNRGAAYWGKDEFDLAIADYNKAIELDPKLAHAYYNRGATYRAEGAFDLAIADCTKAIELDPKLAGAYNNRGVAYRVKGAFDFAIADCTKAIELDPELASAYNDRGAAYIEKGAFDRALADCTKAIELDPKLAQAYNNRGAAYGAKGELDRALADYNKAIELDPNYAEAYNNRGITWLRLQEWENFKSGFLEARNVGIDIAIRFRNVCGSVANFERITGIQLPADITAMLTSSS